MLKHPDFANSAVRTLQGPSGRQVLDRCERKEEVLLSGTSL